MRCGWKVPAATSLCLKSFLCWLINWYVLHVVLQQQLPVRLSLSLSLSVPPRTQLCIRTWTLCHPVIGMTLKSGQWTGRKNLFRCGNLATFVAVPQADQDLRFFSFSLSNSVSLWQFCSSLTLHADLSCDLHVWMAAPQGAHSTNASPMSLWRAAVVLLPFWRGTPRTP